jgi:predicted pyridoxine 5'-phosphate oxidase superfamily flavin-nucleotide-binding protein
MFSDDLREFLKKPHLARISTLDPDGFPHTLPVWYAIDTDDLVMTITRNSRKFGYMSANSKASITIGGGPDDDAGWLFKGNLRITDEDPWPWLEKMTHHYETAEQAAKDLADWTDVALALVRMKPEKCIKFA